MAQRSFSRTPRGIVRLTLALLVVVALLVATGWTVRSYFQVDEVRLPDLVGMDVSQATHVLRDESLAVTTFAENVPSAAAGAVTTQAPPPGAVVRRGRTVSLGVNTPPEAARVPVLVGLTQQEAVQRLRDLNLTAGDVAFAYSERTAGLVIGQEPAAGGNLGGSSDVGLLVSRGPAPQDVDVPDVQGMELGAAVRTLEDLGFTRIETMAATVSFDRPESVTEQMPAAGETVPASTPITLLYALPGSRIVQVPDLAGMPVSRAQLVLRAANLALGPVEYIDDPSRPGGVVQAEPGTFTVAGSPIRLVVNGTPSFIDRLFEPSTTLPTETEPARETPVLGGNDRRAIPFTFDPASMGVRSLTEEAYHLRLVVEDSQGQRNVLDRTVEAGAVISTTVTVHGPDALLQTYVNGVPFQAWRP